VRFVNSALTIQCHVVKNTLLQTAFLTTGFGYLPNYRYKFLHRILNSSILIESLPPMGGGPFYTFNTPI